MDKALVYDISYNQRLLDRSPTESLLFLVLNAISLNITWNTRLLIQIVPFDLHQYEEKNIGEKSWEKEKNVGENILGDI